MIQRINFVVFAFLFMAVTAFASGVEIGNGKNGDPVGGIEIGNGKIDPVSGMEIGNAKGDVRSIKLDAELTAAVSPFGEESFQGEVTENKSFKSVNDLIKAGRRAGWSIVRIGKMIGIKNQPLMSNGILEAEIQLFVERGKVLLLNFEVKQDETNSSEFEKLRQLLASFEIIK